MTAASLIQALQQIDPSVRVLTRWEGELCDLDDGDISFASVHPGYHGENHAEHEDESEDDEGVCFRCDADKPGRHGCFKAIILG